MCACMPRGACVCECVWAGGYGQLRGLHGWRGRGRAHTMNTGRFARMAAHRAGSV